MSDLLKILMKVRNQECLKPLKDVVKREGVDRAKFLFEQLMTKGVELGVESAYASAKVKKYINSIKVSDQPNYPGDIDLEQKIEAVNRWNSTVIVAHANKKDGSIGGHIGTGAGAMTLYEVGFNYFWKVPNEIMLEILYSIRVTYRQSSTLVHTLRVGMTSEQLDNFRKQA